jgi:alpha-amylase
MKRLGLLFGTHNHLPLGQDNAETERTYQAAWKPLLAQLYGHPDFCATLHYSGLLLEWLDEHHPEFITLLTEMVKRGQVEILGGGYYDPILPMIPTNDKLGQLEKMTTHLRVRFEMRPRGCWLAESVWEPSLAFVLRASGLDYTFLDDSQFRRAGAGDPECLRPAIAEDQGKIVSVFPIASGLAPLVCDPERFLAALEGLAGQDPAAVATVLVDGARLELAEGGLDTLLRLAGEAAGWLQPLAPTRYLRDSPPIEKLYIPSSASAEMTEWALPSDTRSLFREARRRERDPGGIGRLLSGGHFRQFLTRYPEAGLMYAKMMYTHVLVNQVRGDRYKKRAAQNELWRGQCHYAYWHGARGGIYSNPLRKAVYRSLIEAEKITRATEIFAPSILSADYDMDNCTEYLYQGSELNAYIHTRGGSLFELDFLPASTNYLDTMAQRDGEARERSHSRKAFLDHFLPEACTIEAFDTGRSAEVGDFVTGLYEVVELNRSLPEVLLRRTGSVSAPDGLAQPVGIDKRYIFRPRSIDVYYEVTNRGARPLATFFAMEMNVSLVARSPESGRIFILDEDRKSEIGLERTEIEGVKGLLVRDVVNEVSITLSSVKAFRFWSLPIETRSRCPEGEERIFQSHCFVGQWPISLAPGETWQNHLSVGFEKTPAP